MEEGEGEKRFLLKMEGKRGRRGRRKKEGRKNEKKKLNEKKNKVKNRKISLKDMADNISKSML